MISSWLVRQDFIRERFDKIVWASLGQTPNLPVLQRVVYEQLTDGMWDMDADADLKMQRLGDAFHGKRVLLVLDDLWNADHEAQLNGIDRATASKVLVSSRVRAVLSNTTTTSGNDTHIVQVAVPDEESAVKMLLSTAGIATDAQAPGEALGIVKFCNLLPLAISIAGQLVKDLDLGATDDWDGILAVLKEEFDDGSKRTVEETVILTSLNAIDGRHKDNIAALFKCLALLPEDVAVPLDILAMMFQASCSTEEKSITRPKIMMIRRWLMVLIERSLVLGVSSRRP
eukprot:COSAG02_NODE_4721_length_5052_cov_14.669695_3_plen_286_part_00